MREVEEEEKEEDTEVGAEGGKETHCRQEVSVE